MHNDILMCLRRTLTCLQEANSNTAACNLPGPHRATEAHARRGETKTCPIRGGTRAPDLARRAGRAQAHLKTELPEYIVMLGNAPGGRRPRPPAERSRALVIVLRGLCNASSTRRSYLRKHMQCVDRQSLTVTAEDSAACLPVARLAHGFGWPGSPGAECARVNEAHMSSYAIPSIRRRAIYRCR
ncbi:hypothetical protein HYPSUDRAFT_221497 [Hypholoma sublateritium FD-334 SS-4]|uniref:Uncharacterized protein n=1 Tax=Hypholoma sublateritium (strain FD-334 SS-4) TaxID=945553 RepID=A0A0D2QD52_HYPSF|nr:hypothetical protein HYPSUDRAFT_221497 [Hypholoma sublateritium FD-334 SS-4]